MYGPKPKNTFQKYLNLNYLNELNYLIIKIFRKHCSKKIIIGIFTFLVKKCGH